MSRWGFKFKNNNPKPHSLLTSYLNFMLQSRQKNTHTNCADSLHYTSAKWRQQQKPLYWCPTLYFRWVRTEGKNNNTVLTPYAMLQPSDDRKKEKKKNIVLMSFPMFQPRTKSHSTDVLPYVSAKDKKPQYWCPSLCFSQGQTATVLMSFPMFQPRTKSHSIDVLPCFS